MPLFLGTSGWSYPEWKDGFYVGVPRRRWLEHYAAQFPAVEVNATFYRTLRRETLLRWRDAVPPCFRFALKGHRMVTHIRRLVDVAENLDQQRASLEPLAAKIAAVLWQLPADLAKDLALLERFAIALERWSGPHHVIEFREPSWFDDETAACLAAAGLGSAISDAGRWQRWDFARSGLAYLRLHGRPKTYRSAYSDDALTDWAARVRSWLDAGWEVHVYFDNTMEAAAPDDALRLRALIDDAGAPLSASNR